MVWMGGGYRGDGSLYTSAPAPAPAPAPALTWDTVAPPASAPAGGVPFTQAPPTNLPGAEEGTPTSGTGTGAPGVYQGGSGWPAIPDYTKLAEQTAQSNRDAAWGQTWANRPNQTDQYGNTLTWSQDPTTGQWTQRTTLGGTSQGFQDQENAIRGGLLGQVGSMGPLTADGLPETNANAGMLGRAGTFNMDPVGNAKAIQDATYGLLSPMRTELRNAEIQRLKNQGLTEDSPAFQRAMLRLGQGDTDAQLKALLAGTTEYGNQFQRGLSANNQNFGQSLQQQQLASALRSQGFGERQAIHDQPLTDLGRFSGIKSAGGPEFSSFMSATNPGGTDYVGAASAQNSANIARFNAEQKAKAEKAAIWTQLGSAAVNNPEIANLVKQYGGSVLDWAKGLFSGGSGGETTYPPYGDESDIPG